MSLTRNQLLRLFPKASHAFYDANSIKDSPMATKLPDPFPQQTCGSKQVECPKAQERSQGRIKIRIVRLGVHLCDPDNLSGAKILIDELRAAKLIPSDDPYSIELELCQIKAPKEMRGTLIEIIP